MARAITVRLDLTGVGAVVLSMTNEDEKNVSSVHRENEIHAMADAARRALVGDGWISGDAEDLEVDVTFEEDDHKRN